MAAGAMARSLSTSFTAVVVPPSPSSGRLHRPGLLPLTANPGRVLAGRVATGPWICWTPAKAHSSGDGVPSEEEEEELEIVRRIKSKQQELREKYARDGPIPPSTMDKSHQDRIVAVADPTLSLWADVARSLKPMRFSWLEQVELNGIVIIRIAEIARAGRAEWGNVSGLAEELHELRRLLSSTAAAPLPRYWDYPPNVTLTLTASDSKDCQMSFLHYLDTVFYTVKHDVEAILEYWRLV